MKWGKWFLAVLLIPFVAAQGRVLWDLAWLGYESGAWKNAWFTPFCAGLAAWFLVYFLLPRPMWIYVFGHELTHALAVWMAGGRVYAFKVKSTGGHVKIDRVNWWISLSPYFIPLYALLWLALWWGVDFFWPLSRWLWVFYFVLALAWGFHVTFTVSMSKLDQPDWRSEGYVFSFVVIVLINAALMQFFIVVVEPSLSWKFWLASQWHHVSACYEFTGRTIFQAYAWLWENFRDRVLDGGGGTK